MGYDFSGYATKNDLKCADGRIIRRDAFKENDGAVVPLVWQHLHDDPANVLGHALLENRQDGVYAYCSFNDSDQAKHAKELVKHGDITTMSIFANRLVQKGSDVLHGVIREVSLVLAGANPGAKIENLSFEHSDGSWEEIVDEACIYSDSPINTLAHADEEETMEDERTLQDVYDTLNDEQKELVDVMINHAVDEATENLSHADDEGTDAEDDKTIQDVFDSMTEEQKNVVYYLIAQAAGEQEAEDEEAEHSAIDESDAEIEHSDELGENFMKHNVFDQTTEAEENVISHDEINAAIADAKRIGSMKEAFLQHGITNLEVLFPEAKLVGDNPALISRPMDWVSKVWNATKKSPFARIKSVAANVTADEARAKGYIKGKKKVEEVITMLKRATTPQTVYKLQKMDRDDIIDITDIDIVQWLKGEMRMMLEEELARAVMIGDGRNASAEDKIKEENIRPIYGDDNTYTIYHTVDQSASDPTEKANALIDAALLARKNYMGSGNPTFYASTDVINSLLLAKDKIGRRLYSTTRELADVLRVADIVEIPVFEGVERKQTANQWGSGNPAEEGTFELLALIVNLNDYTVGADKGGEVNLFDDFDIDYNKYSYLIETRVSGALTKPYAAIALEAKKA